MSASAVRSEYASLLTRTLPSVIGSETENERYIGVLEELDRKASRMSAAERRLAQLPLYLLRILKRNITRSRPPAPSTS